MTSSQTTIPGYELIRELGVGGMATVWLAVQRSLDRKIAIKVMKRNIDDLEKFERRFLQEGRTMAKLPHRNIVAVYDIVKGEDVSYIAMEYLDGGTLSQKMKEGLSLAEAISVVVQIAAALQFAHEHGVVHRDLKPANIMFRDEATPVLTDFGIAKQQDQQSTRLTQTGMLVGTPTYMSPEQINALEVDGRSDLYSLGVLFYELLTGAPPFQADTPIAVLMAHLTTPPPPLPEQFADFQPVVERMLAKARDDRFQDMREFTRALKAAVTNNEYLWQRLQADPSASSSEQLRALGFSISGPASGRMPGISPSQQVRLPPSGSGQPRTPTPSGGFATPPGYGGPSYPGQGYAGQSSPGMPAPPRKFPIAIVGGVAALLLVAVLAFVMWPKPEIDPAVKQIVDLQLSGFRDRLTQKDLAGARESLLAILPVAPDYSKTKEAVGELAKAFGANAEASLAQGKFDEASVALANASGLSPDDPALAALEKKIADARNQAANRQKVAALVARVDAAERANRFAGADGAYGLLQQARALVPNDATLKQRSDAVVAKLLAPVRESVKRNDLSAARDRMTALATELANDPGYVALRGEIDQAVDTQAKRVRVAGMLQRFDRQLAAGRLLEPPGDNARESLSAAQAALPRDAEVEQRRIALTTKLVQRAQAALAANDVEGALNAASDALSVKPDDAAAARLKATAVGRLDANRAKVLGGLAAARQAIAEGRFLPPANPNARTEVENVLKLDPRNADAQQMLAELPTRIAEAAEQRLAANDFAGAEALLAQGRATYASDAKLAALATQVSQKSTAAKAEAARTATLQAIAQRIATRPVAPAAIGTAAREIAQLLAANSADVDARTLKQRLFETLAEALEAATAATDVDVVAQASREAEKAFPNDAALADLGAKLASNRARVAAAEKERLAAVSGRLVMNAYPWGTVESVVDAQGKAVTLPGDAVTPFAIDVPQGVYYVTFKNPQGTRRTREAAQVKARQSVVASASFAVDANAKEYLKRAGF